MDLPDSFLCYNVQIFKKQDLSIECFARGTNSHPQTGRIVSCHLSLLPRVKNCNVICVTQNKHRVLENLCRKQAY